MPTTLFNNNQVVPCFDNCSSCSYILKCTADTLQYKPSRTTEVSIRGAFSEDTVSSNLVQLHIGLFNSNSATLTLQSVYSVEMVSFDLTDVAKLTNACYLYDHLRYIAFSGLLDNSVHILLGVDAFWHIAGMEILKSPPGSAYGPLHQKSLENQYNSHPII